MAKHGVKIEAEESNRMWASASFVGVLIVIGLPLWWKTTEVYRVALPFDKISSFHQLPHAITTELVVVAGDDATADEVVGLIEKSFKDCDIIKLDIKKRILSPDLHKAIVSATDEHRSVEEISLHFDLTKHNTFYVVQHDRLVQNVWVAGERVALFKNAAAAPTIVQVLKHWIYQTDVLGGAASETADAARRTRFPPGDYHVVLSVVQPRPDIMNVNFNAEEAVEDYIGSFVDELSVLHNFTLKSQWLYLLDFDFQAKEVEDTSEWGRLFAVREDRLHLLLTRLEQRVATHVSSLPTLNLALYAVPCPAAPLAIDHQGNLIPSGVQAFMSPKWGGVVLGNPTAAECGAETPEYKPKVPQVMGAFVAQLRKLVGITDTEHLQGAHLQPLRSVVPRRWEIDNLLRMRTLEQLTSAEATLQSLAQLLGAISNIVINDDVGASINLAVEKIELASALMAKGELPAAYKTSLEAFHAAETAFMEPSLLALLYFPDDQKYAVYIPLFLPIMFPVVLSLKNLLLWLRGKPLHKEKTE